MIDLERVPRRVPHNSQTPPDPLPIYMTFKRKPPSIHSSWLRLLFSRHTHLNTFETEHSSVLQAHPGPSSSDWQLGQRDAKEPLAQERDFESHQRVVAEIQPFPVVLATHSLGKIILRDTNNKVKGYQINFQLFNILKSAASFSWGE